MQLAGNDHRCILICMFACWKKFCYAALTAKTFANFAPFLDPKIEVEKWTQKWCQNLTPKMESKNGTQKGGPQTCVADGRQVNVSALWLSHTVEALSPKKNQSARKKQ